MNRKLFVIYNQAETEKAGEASFWNNDSGWGTLATATVFTEKEQETLALPATEPEHPSEWVGLPVFSRPKTKVAFSIENLTLYRKAVALGTKIYGLHTSPSFIENKSEASNTVTSKVREVGMAIVLNIASGLGFWENQWKIVHLTSARRNLLELPALLELMVALDDLSPEKEGELNDDIRELMTELNNVIRMVKRRRDNADSNQKES